MANVLILGESGTGKSTSIRTLNPNETFLIQVISKPLPFKGAMKKYNTESKNLYVTDDYAKIIGAIDKINKNETIKSIVIDDSQYIMANEFMRRAKEKGYEKYSELADHYWRILEKIGEVRQNLDIFVLSHIEENDKGKIQVKTIGKLLNEKITIEGMFTIVLRTEVEDGKYSFRTQNNGYDTVKSPMGMFETELIDNDLQYVKDQIKKYYEED